VRLVVGLGNPGPRHAGTRHNAGALVVETLARRHDVALDGTRFAGRLGRGLVAGAPAALLVPGTFMNRSGESVAAAERGLPVVDPARELLVVYDDLDLPFGRLRLRPAGGSGGHRGVRDVMERLADLGVARDGGAFPRLRFGIGRPPAGIDAVTWVLEPFDAEQRAALPTHLAAAADAVETVLREGVEPAMSRVNRPPAAAAEPGDGDSG